MNILSLASPSNAANDPGNPIPLVHFFLRRAAFLFILLLAAAVPGNAITFNNTWDPSINTYLLASDVPKFQAAVIYAEQQFQNVFTDAITINLTFVVRRGTRTLGASVTTFQPTTFAEVKSALTAGAVSPADLSSVANLPASDPGGPGGWSLPSAEAKALGLLAAADPGLDGTVYFGGGNPYTYDPANRKVVGKYDFIGIAIHEISEVMGRNSNLDTVPVGAAPYDLFRYTARGALSMDPNAVSVYFSADGGATALNFFNSDPSGDDRPGPYPSHHQPPGKLGCVERDHRNVVQLHHHQLDGFLQRYEFRRQPDRQRAERNGSRWIAGRIGASRG